MNRHSLTLAACLLLITGTMAHGQSVLICESYPAGEYVVPPVETDAFGYLEALWPDFSFEGEYPLGLTLYYYDLSSDPTGASLRSAGPGQNGPVVFSLATEYFESGATFVFDVDLFEDEELLQQMDQGLLYVVVETPNHPDGEIRGQLVCGFTPTRSITWGSIKLTYR